MATPLPSSTRGPIREITIKAPGTPKGLKGKDHHGERFSTPGPINFLPPEVLGDIFLASLDKTFPTHNDDSVPPLQFCLVSTHWRQTALSTPGLWTRLSINHDATIQDIAKITGKWFLHSGQLPLSLRIQNLVNPSYSELGRSLTGTSFKATQQHSWSRIHNLELTVFRVVDAVRLLNALVGPEADLERLVIRYSQRHWATSTRLTIPMFRKLRRFVLAVRPHVDRSLYDGNFDNVPWNQLTHLSMIDNPMMPATWVVLLRWCTHLQHGIFSLNNLEDVSPPANQGAHFVFQKDTVFQSMISLKIVFKNAGEWGILDGLSFPSLKTLCLGSMEGLSTWPSTTSATLHTPLVKNLTLFKLRIQYTDLIAFLKTMASLRALVLDAPLDYSPLFDKLSHIGTNIFLPNLVRLSIYHWRSIRNQPIHIDNKALLQMIRARWYRRSTTPRPQRSPLSSVSLRTSGHAPPIIPVKVALNPLITEGFSLQTGLAPTGYVFKKEVDW